MNQLYLIGRFFNGGDIILFPLCFILFFSIIRYKANRQTDPAIRKLYYRAFYFKTIGVLLFTLITAFYFKGGDTNLFYQASKDLRTAIDDDLDNAWLILNTVKLTGNHPLFNYFYYDNFDQDITYGYMITTSNFLPGKLALIPSYLFFDSYLCINMFFGFWALGGAIRLFKFFYYFYPRLWRELALACLFVPSVVFWSSGLLKDPVTFGCVGYILYAILQLVYIKKNTVSSVLWILISAYLSFYIKAYILLVLLLSILVWVFAEFNKVIKEKVLRYIFSLFTFAISVVIAYFLLNYLTSTEAAKEFQLSTVMENAEQQRKGYEHIGLVQGGSHFKINASNPFLLVVESIGATYFRPFLWEVSSPIVLLSAIEAAIFSFFTLFFFYKRGPGKFFTMAFEDGRILLCLVFALVFAFSVGSSTGNFGALSRYKIPCTPFYLILLLLLYTRAKLHFPNWFNKVVDFAVPIKK
ncbi:MAG: hypothetical protein HZA79_00290 [Sphingobacteriales bacterium]|nr:hypothetical protein [Sphingobacteriales bacterium]